MQNVHIHALFRYMHRMHLYMKYFMQLKHTQFSTVIRAAPIYELLCINMRISEQCGP